MTQAFDCLKVRTYKKESKNNPHDVSVKLSTAQDWQRRYNCASKKAACTPADKTDCTRRGGRDRHKKQRMDSMGFLVPVTKDREKLEAQINALKWALSQDEDEKSRTYHAAFLEILKKERDAVQGG